jgi:TRAP-type uncharacterized transport system fused permease subunit
VVQVLVTAAIGVALLACATEGWLGGPLNRPLRAVTFAAAILLITPGVTTDLIGLALAAAIWLYRRFLRPAPATPT